MWRSSKKPLQANIATLKVHLGRYLKLVRKGMEVIVRDRQTPVAKLVPFHTDTSLVIRPVRVAWTKIVAMMRKHDLQIKPTKLGKSSLQYLTEDRESK